jgi:hypothetical protein
MNTNMLRELRGRSFRQPHGRTSTYAGAQFHRFHRRFGKQGAKKAAIATAHTLIVIV